MLDYLMTVIMSNINMSKLFAPGDPGVALNNTEHIREGDRLIQVLRQGNTKWLRFAKGLNAS